MEGPKTTPEQNHIPLNVLLLYAGSSLEAIYFYLKQQELVPAFISVQEMI
jgi:hypothetical protein